MRLLIAITQHDLHYTDDAELELDALDVTAYVQNCLSQMQLDIHSNSVIQVSGLWALLASDLRNIPSDTGIRRKAQEVYEMLPDKCKSDVTCGDVTEAIEITSNICKLQSRFEQFMLCMHIFGASMGEPYTREYICKICLIYVYRTSYVHDRVCAPCVGNMRVIQQHVCTRMSFHF